MSGGVGATETPLIELPREGEDTHSNDPPIFDSEDTPKGAATQAPAAEDAEEIARRLNAQRLAIGEDGELPPDVALPAFGDPAQPPEDWVVHGPDGEVHVSQARESVSLPVSVRVFYDWARQEGWFQGDGSLSAFVTDTLLDHFANCMGKVLVVADREEVGIG